MSKGKQGTATDAKPATTTESKPAKVAAPAQFCFCSCGIESGKRSSWRQGHDARAKGWLQRVAAGRCFEGERELAEALLKRTDPRGALKTDAFAPLAEAARAALKQSAAA